MDYDELWKTLEDLVVELTKKRVTLPEELISDLKSAKTLINILKTEPTAVDLVTKIEIYMGNLESNLLYIAESDVSKNYADLWMAKIMNARSGKNAEQPIVKARFVSGIPKGEHWIRLKPSGLIADSKLRELLKKFDLKSKLHENTYLLISGKEENIKSFIKEIGEKIGKK